ncbi:MAG: DUF418 domain-containing protein [Burkholderiales bacterium]|nr:MAG: DUF418 domain-containing protein [Burkholderiales bacterium]
MTSDGRVVERLDVVDALRGFALLGLFLVHCVELFELYWAHPTPGPVFDWVFGLFSGKSYALFALCFGLSFFLIMDSAARRGEDFRGRFVWRLTLLLGFGILHSFLYRGDILQILAILGVVMLALDRIKNNKLLLAVAGLCFLQIPLLVRALAAATGAPWAIAPAVFMSDTTMPVLTDGSFSEVIGVNLVHGQAMKWSFYLETGRVVQMLGLFVLGLVLGRIGFFSDLERHQRLRRTSLVVAATLTVLLYWTGPQLLNAIAADSPRSRPHLQWALDSWKALGVLGVQVLIFVELYRTGARAVFGTLVPAGRMTLTLYLAQSIIFVPVFYGFGLDLHDDLTLLQCLLIGMVAFALQMGFATWWLRRFRFGPVEWLWRAATRTTLDVPFRHSRSSAISTTR